MTAHDRMQFNEMSELDTLAVVFIFEYWAQEIGWLNRRDAA